ncbi:MAG: D-aminoacyl-tRNA deacylase [Actinobacteria bacterium]|nr:D-aminoacyl-tRNA deacylase [Actinomycetota bacterium]
MIAVIQRVRKASVKVNEKIVSEIGKGVLCFVAVLKGDTEEDANYLAERIPKLRIFEDENGKMNRSLIDVQGEILLVSQFTLAANLTKGLRPGFDMAETPNKAQELIELMIKFFTRNSITCKSGAFGAHMQVELVNDGPATFVINTKERRKD